jgi:hypothetical protein
VHPTPRTPFYLTLDEALAQGTVQATEVSKRGRVPELLFSNGEDRPVLLIDREELVSTKQDWVQNPTTQAGPHSELVISVSSVEQGRWHEVSAVFCVAACPCCRRQSRLA